MTVPAGPSTGPPSLPRRTTFLHRSMAVAWAGVRRAVVPQRMWTTGTLECGSTSTEAGWAEVRCARLLKTRYRLGAPARHFHSETLRISKFPKSPKLQTLVWQCAGLMLNVGNSNQVTHHFPDLSRREWLPERLWTRLHERRARSPPTLPRR